MSEAKLLEMFDFREGHTISEIKTLAREHFGLSRRVAMVVFNSMEVFLCFSGRNDWMRFLSGDHCAIVKAHKAAQVIAAEAKVAVAVKPKKGKTLVENLPEVAAPFSFSHRFIVASIVRHALQQGWVAKTEVRFDTRRADVVAWRGEYSMAFEAKVNLGDYLSEIGNPAKRRPIVQQVNEFWFVVPIHLPVPVPPQGFGVLTCDKQGKLAVRKWV